MIKTRLIKLLKNARKYIGFQIMWQWFSLLCQVCLIFCIANLFQDVVENNIDVRQTAAAAVIISVTIILRFIFDRETSYASFKASVDVKKVLRQKIYEKLLRLGSSYRESTSTAEIVQLAGEGVEQLEIYFGKYLSQFFYSLLAPLTLFAILSFVNVKASVVLLICVPLIPLSIVVVMKIAKRLLNKYWGLYAELGDSFLENLQGLTTCKIYKADKLKEDEMDVESQKFRHVTMKVLTMQLNSTSVMDIMAYGGSAVGIIVTILEYTKGNVSLAGSLMIILLSSEFFIPLRLLGSFFHIAMNGMAASDKIFKLLDLEESSEKELCLEKGSCSINIKDLSFAYNKDRQILSNINIVTKENGITAFAGTSGCGKSTITGILTGRNKNYTGSVKIQDKELSSINEASLMQNVTLVNHNSYLFKGTVRDNLLMAKREAKDSELEEVLRQVNLYGFLSGQKGLDTLIEEKGSNLSGGQCQRLALARALLHDSPVYIFDEATSNIDMESEEMIMDVVHKLSLTKNIILISHRLANVVKADCIYMIKEGKIIQSGTHEQLMKQGGDYKELFEKQKALEEYSAGQSTVEVKA